MICEHCQTPIPEGSHFCLSCGADQSDPTVGTPTADLTEEDVDKLARLLYEESGGEYEVAG